MTLSSVPQQSHAASSELQACGCQLLMALSADGEYAGADRKFSSQNRLQNPGGGGGLPYERGEEARVDIFENGILGLVPRKMVKFNPELSQVLSKVFLSYNMQLELTKYCCNFTSKKRNDNTKFHSKQFIGR